MVRNLQRQIPWILAVAVVGAVAFVLVQKSAGATVITDYLGAAITRRGGYDPGLAPVVGWGVHLGVSTSYAVLFALVAEVLPKARVVRLAGTLVAALALGWVTTLITQPAISVTISLLSGNGFPGSLPGLNFTTGLILRNHVYFFLIAWAGLVLARDLLPRPFGTRSSASAAA